MLVFYIPLARCSNSMDVLDSAFHTYSASMAPPRMRGSGEELRSDASNAKDKQASGLGVSKGRRSGNSAVITGSALKDNTAAQTATNLQNGGQDGPGGVLRPDQRPREFMLTLCHYIDKLVHFRYDYAPCLQASTSPERSLRL